MAEKGRAGKAEDICYSFWTGAALAVLGRARLCRPHWARYLLMCQAAAGGLKRSPLDAAADPVHTSQGLLALHLLPTEAGLFAAARPAIAETALLLPAGFLADTLQRVK